MIPELLRKALHSKWSPQDSRSETSDIPKVSSATSKPRDINLMLVQFHPQKKVLYVNPTGANPTGVSLPLERRQEIYEIARDFNLLIFEDDPYYFLQFEEQRTPSFLSLDVDGRVIRFDSLSKVLSSGIRIGYVTGPKALLEPIMFHMQVSVLHASSMSQVRYISYWLPHFIFISFTKNKGDHQPAAGPVGTARVSRSRKQSSTVLPEST